MFTNLVYFFRRELDINGWEDVDGIREMSENVNKIVNDVVAQWNVPRNRIILGKIQYLIYFQVDVFYSQVDSAKEVTYLYMLLTVTNVK